MMNLLYKEFKNKDYTIKVYREYYYDRFNSNLIYKLFKNKEKLIFILYKNNTLEINKIFECQKIIKTDSKSIINYIKNHKILSKYFDNMKEINNTIDKYKIDIEEESSDE